MPTDVVDTPRGIEQAAQSEFVASIAAENRAARRRKGIDVCFTVTSDDFRVPEWPGLRCSAEFEASGTVKFDDSGDSITPNGAPDVEVGLLDPVNYIVSQGDRELPEWLQQKLALECADQFDAAFLAAIGGQDALDALAIEEAGN